MWLHKFQDKRAHAIGNEQATYIILPSGKPKAIVPVKQMPYAQLRAYDNACRAFRRHHPEIPPCRGQQFTYLNSLILEDPTIQRYLIAIKSRPRNNGYLSPSTKQMAVTSARHFLSFLRIQPSNHALTGLIATKKANMSDFTLDDKLEEFANLEPIIAHRQYGTYILGIFKANRARLQATSDCHFDALTKPISEGILNSIFHEIDEKQQDIINYQAFSGQRINCLSTIPLNQIDLSRQNYAVIHVFKYQNKSRQEHDTLVPFALMQRIVKRAKDNNLDSPYPDYKEIWTQITTLAAVKYNVRFTSHYLRHRFHSIASDTPMDVNQWDYLMGSKKRKGHDAQTYNLNFLDEKLIPNYDRFLARQLEIGTPKTSPVFQQNSNDNALLELVKQQQETINRLTSLLTQSNSVKPLAPTPIN